MPLLRIILLGLTAAYALACKDDPLENAEFLDDDGGIRPLDPETIPPELTEPPDTPHDNFAQCYDPRQSFQLYLIGKGVNTKKAQSVDGGMATLSDGKPIDGSFNMTIDRQTTLPDDYQPNRVTYPRMGPSLCAYHCATDMWSSIKCRYCSHRTCGARMPLESVMDYWSLV